MMGLIAAITVCSWSRLYSTRCYACQDYVLWQLRPVDFVICSVLWAMSRAANRTYSHIKFHSGQHIMRGWISVARPVTAVAILPQPQSQK